MASLISYIQLGLSILLIIGVLLQRSEAGLGAAFGGDSMNTRYTRRGFERTLFIGTIVISVLFAATAFLSLFLRS